MAARAGQGRLHRERMTQQECAECGRSQGTPLRPVRPVLKRIYVCDECFHRRMRRGLISLVAFALIPALLTVPSHGPWGVIGALAFLACFPLALLGHEAGHALAGWAVGLRIRRVELGVGGELTRLRIGSTSVVIRALPVAGKVMFGGGPRRRARSRFLISIGAGPAASAAVAVIGWAIPLPVVSAGLVIAGTLGCIGSLWPRKQIPALRVPTDGYQLVTLLRADDAVIGATMAAWWAIEVSELYQLGKLEESGRRVEDGLREYPADPTLALLRAVILTETRPFDGLAAFHALSELLPEVPQMRAAVLNGFAWAALLSWDPDLLEDADRASAEAYELDPDNEGICDTRGLALIRTGRPEEGLQLAQRAMASKRFGPRDRAHVQCGLALGCAALGDMAVSQAHLAEARQVLPEHDVLLARVSEALSGALIAAG